MKKTWIFGAAALAAAFAPASFAQTAPQATDAAADDAGSELIIIGVGQTRQGQTLTAETLEAMPAGTSPIKLVQRLPGVAFSGADTFGAYEWAARINVRGFAQSQLGFTLDGVPLGDMSYANHNGLHISRALISENLGRVELTQGSGAIDVASSSNLAGALQFFSVQPNEEFGADAAITVGDYSTLRGFVRVNSGEIGPYKTRGWLSFMDSGMDKWKGEGEQNQQQYALKIVQPILKGELTAYYNNSERQEQDYQDLSQEMIRRLGNDWDNFGSSNWDLAVRVADIAHNRGDTGQPVTNAAAGRVYPAPIASADDAYFDASGLRDDEIGYLKLDYPITDNLDLSAQVYSHHNQGMGLWGTPYRVSPNATVAGATTDNAPLSIRTTEYNIDRTGLLGSLTWRLGDHTINAGYWWETNDFNQFRRFYGLNRASPQRSFLNMQSNPFFTQWAYTFATETLQFYLQDTWQVTDKLKLNAGFKTLSVENKVTTIQINNARPTGDANLRGTIKTEENFLPQLGAVYDLNDDIQLFASYAKNVAAFPSVVGSVFGSRSQAVFEEIRRTVDPESAQTVEGGVRVRGDRYQLGAAAYYVLFQDRLLAVSQGPGIVGNAPIVSNVGDVETIGLELVGSLDITDHLRAYASYTYNQSEYQDDVRNRAGVLQAATGGKTVVNTPNHLFFAELAYDQGPVFASVSTNFIGDRESTFTNVGGLVDGRWLTDLSLGYRFSGSPILEGLEAQVNVANLLDDRYIGTLGTNGFVNAGDSQTFVTGAPRQILLTIRKKF